MKKVNLSFAGLLVVALLCSCSSEENLEIFNSEPKSNPTNVRLGTVLPGNKSNPLDFAGESYRSILSDYQSGDYSPDSLAEVVAIVDALRGLPIITTTPVDDTTNALLAGIIDSPEVTFVSILHESGLSQNAKDILSDFVDGFDSFKANPFEDIYPEIVSLETTVSSSDLLTTEDKRILLTVMSIARYSLSNKCCEDTDWETSVGNIVAATAGALINADKAIRYTLITRIGEYELVPL